MEASDVPGLLRLQKQMVMLVHVRAMAVAVVEWLATGIGVGTLMAMAASVSNYSLLWATVALVTAVSALGHAGVRLVETRVLARYAPEKRHDAAPGHPCHSGRDCHPRKGQDILLQALARLVHHDWQAVIVGAAYDPAHAAELARLHDRLRLAGRVRMAGQVPDGLPV